MADIKESENQDFRARSIYKLDIHVIRAIELPKLDTFGQSDGFVKVTAEAGFIKRKFRTIVVKKSLNPEWDAKTQFLFYEEPKELLFRVMDWNQPPQPDSPIGSYTLNLAGYFKRNHPGFSGRVALNDAKRGEIEIKVECKLIEPFNLITQYQRLSAALKDNKKKISAVNDKMTEKQQEKQSLEQQVARCQQDNDQRDQDRKTLQREMHKQQRLGTKLNDQLARLRNECKSLEDEYQSLERTVVTEVQRLQQARQANEERERSKHAYTDSRGQADLQQFDVIEQMKAYRRFLSVDSEQDETPPPPNFDPRDICKRALTAYRDTYGEAQQLKHSADETKQSEEEEQQYASAERKARVYLRELQKFRNLCAKTATNKTDKYIQEDGYQHQQSQQQFYRAFYDVLLQFFINVYIIAATLEVFGDEMPERFNKKANKITYHDLAGTNFNQPRNDNASDDDDKEDPEENNETNSIGIWKQLYPSSELDFVITQMDNILSNFMKKQPLQPLCDKVYSFMREYSDGHFTEFSRLLTHFVIVEKTKHDKQFFETQNLNAFTNDSIAAVVLLFNDRKEFLLRFYRSLEAAEQRQNQNEQDADSTQQPVPKAEDCAFEMIVALILILVQQLDNLVHNDVVLTQEDKKQISDAASKVETECNEKKVDAKSAKLCKEFFDYFFAPQSGGGCCQCDPEAGGVMGFFGKLFGGMCNK